MAPADRDPPSAALASLLAKPAAERTAEETQNLFLELLRAEVEAAGFKLVASGDFLRRPEDQRDAPVFRNPTPVDEFVLKFQKP
jgi:predicted methyltransferase